MDTNHLKNRVGGLDKAMTARWDEEREYRDTDIEMGDSAPRPARLRKDPAQPTGARPRRLIRSRDAHCSWEFAGCRRGLSGEWRSSPVVFAPDGPAAFPTPSLPQPTLCPKYRA
ncbi:uncharacterized protein [Physcomitrium patens]|uniref:uncharacterized protein n=1 Tax=Physcomitrium patens TaxID=3218 RepID=UPI003CCCB79B